jgi:hypothetical protein
MKKIFLVAALVTLAATASKAQAPGTLAYQGILLDADGIPLPNKPSDAPYQITFSFYHQETGGTAFLTRGVFLVRPTRGIFTLVLGDGSTGNDPLPSTVWDSPTWMTFSVDGGTELEPRLKFTGVPFAHRAEKATQADNASSVNDNAITNAKLDDNAVNTAEIAGNAVTSAKIADGTIITEDLAAGSVTVDKVAANSITNVKLDDNAVNTAEIVASAVTSAKIADGTIVSDDLANGSVTTDKIVSLDATKLTGTLPGSILGTGPANQLAFWNSPNGLTSNANLFWDNANSRLGIGTSTPSQKLDVSGTVNATAFTGSGAGLTSLPASQLTGTLPAAVLGAGTASQIAFWNASANAITTHPDLSWNAGNSRLGIGTNTPASKLDVEGGAAIGAAYSGTSAAPANGAIIEGSVGIGTNTPLYGLDLVSTGATSLAERSLNIVNSYSGANDSYVIRGNSVSSGATEYGVFMEGEDLNYFSSGISIGSTTPVLPASLAVATSGQYGMVLSNTYNGSSFKYGLTNIVSADGLGERGAISNFVTGNSGASQPSYGVRNSLTADGSSTSVGTWNVITGTGSGYRFGSYNDVTGNLSLDVYGDYSTATNSGSGNVYGNMLFSAKPVSTTGSVVGVGVAANHQGTSGNSYILQGSSNSAAAINEYGLHISGEEFNFLAGNLGLSVLTPINKLDVGGGMAIGTYAGVATAPALGAIIEGNVGIGTNNPTQKLDVNGTVKATTFSGSGSGLTNMSSSQLSGVLPSAVLGSGGANQIAFWNSTPDALTVKPQLYWDNTNSRLGIGTTSPANKLDVEGGLAIGASYSGTNAAPADGVIIEGKVGIGTNNPGNPLHIATSGTVPASGSPLYIDNDFSGTDHKYGMLINISTQGTGFRRGIYNGVNGHASSGLTMYGIENSIVPNGPAEAYAVYTNIQNSGSGSHYGTYNLIAGNTTGTVGGAYSSATNTGTGVSYGFSALVSGNGGGTAYGSTASVAKSASSTGDLFGLNVIADHDGTGNSYVLFGNTQGAVSGVTKYGIVLQGEDRNSFNGKVGIGVDPAVNKLDVEGAVAIGSTYSGTNTAPTNGVIIEGNVGIGVTGPTQKLEVNGTVVATTFSGSGTSLTSLPAGQLNGTIPAAVLGTGSANQIAFWNGTPDAFTTNSNLFWANATSRLGVGTNSPASRLDVEGGISIGTAYSGTTAAPTNGVIIEGNVGIGNNNPSVKLHVSGNSNLALLQGTNSAYIEYNPDGAGVEGSIGFTGTSDDHLSISNSSATGRIRISTVQATAASGGGGAEIGYNNLAEGDHSMVIGSNARLSSAADGSMFLADYVAAGSQQTITASNSFIGRFANGYYLHTNSAMTSGVQVGASGTSWTTISDSTKKENFRNIDGELILKKIHALRLGTWNYKFHGPSIRHYGPMAQEFYSAFGFDDIGHIGNDSTISTQDISGVNITAIKALIERTDELRKTQVILRNSQMELQLRMSELVEAQKRIDSYKENLAVLEEQFARLESMVRDMAEKQNNK